MYSDFQGLRHSVCAAAVLLAACASGPDVRVDYDKSADFGEYTTYGFVTQPDTDTGDTRSLVTRSLQRAVANEMEARGYTRSETPDLAINFRGKLEEKADIESLPAPYYGRGWRYRGYYGAPYGGWGGVQTVTHRYTMGKLVIDIVDRAQQQVVFQGATEGIVTEKMLDERDQTIAQAVADIFAAYPFVAGSPEPVPASTDK